MKSAIAVFYRCFLLNNDTTSNFLIELRRKQYWALRMHLRNFVCPALVGIEPAMPERESIAAENKLMILNGTVTLDDEPDLDGRHPGTRASRRWKPESTTASTTALNMRRMLDAVDRSIPLKTFELPGEFFPAHLSVALVNLVFRFGLGNADQPTPAAERYCRRFGLAHVRTGVRALPRCVEQETLRSLIGRYRELGLDRMASEVFGSRCYFPGTEIPRVAYVVRIADELARIGVNRLQDVQLRRLRHIDEVLRPLPGVDEHFVRMLLMYTGDDDRVVGDHRVRSFVARAIDRGTVSATEAVNLVRQSAHELILSPRYLDYHIWRCGVAPKEKPVFDAT